MIFRFIRRQHYSLVVLKWFLLLSLPKIGIAQTQPKGSYLLRPLQNSSTPAETANATPPAPLSTQPPAMPLQTLPPAIYSSTPEPSVPEHPPVTTTTTTTTTTQRAVSPSPNAPSVYDPSSNNGGVASRDEEKLARESVRSVDTSNFPKTVKLQFVNTDVADILDNYYAPLTGKHVIYDNTIQGKLTIFINTPVEREEAIRILESQLMLSGFPIVHGEGDILKVINGTKNARTAGPPIFSDLSQLPEGERVVSFLIKPRFIDILELQQALSLYIPVQNQYTSFIALPKTGAILATENSSTIRRIMHLVDQLDVPPSNVIDRFIKLERADASKAVEFVNTVLKRDKSGAAVPGGMPGMPGMAAGMPNPNANNPRRFPREGIPGARVNNQNVAGSGEVLTEGSLIAGDIVITADVRTNRVHVVARPVDFPFIKRLITDFDANTPFAQPVKRNLRFIKANDVLPILVQALTEPGQEGGQNDPNANPNASPSPGRAGGGMFDSDANASRNNGPGGNESTNNIGQSQLDTPEVDTRPISAMVGTTRLIADQRVNAIIVLGGAEARDKVIEIINELDVPTQQVMIEAVIGELKLTNNKEFGLDYIFNVSNSVVSTNYARAPLSAVTNRPVPNPNGGGTEPINTTLGIIGQLAQTAFNPTSPSFAGIITPIHNLQVIINALENSGRFKTISRPTVFTSNNKKAIIASGTEIPIPTNVTSGIVTATNTTGIGTSVQSNVEYKDVTLQLEVVPLINSRNEVTLEVYQKIDNVIPGAAINISGTNVPAISTRKLRSSVSVPNEGTVVLGGLIVQNQDFHYNRVPLLSRVPIVGNLFKNKINDQDRDELMIFLHPRVSNSCTELVSTRYKEEEMLYMEPDLSGQLKAVKKAIPIHIPPPVPKPAPWAECQAIHELDEADKGFLPTNN